MPEWLHILSIGSLVAGLLCATAIALDEYQHPQPMWIMNLVWPLTALFGSVAVAWFYWSFGRSSGQQQSMGEMNHSMGNMNHSMTEMDHSMDDMDHAKDSAAFPVSVAKAALHCGSGCTLGDILAEWLAFSIPTIAVWLGWQSLFSDKLFAVWVLDFIFAFSIGIVFQYFTIKPMNNELTALGALKKSLQADVLSLCSWQLGMYGFMAFAYFYLFRTVLGTELKVPTVEFWFMMQIAMVCGFITAYPVNWWLVRSGVKEPM